MTQSSHATLATFRMDLAREEEQREALRRVIVARRAAGSRRSSGPLDTRSIDAESIVMITYGSLVAAGAMAANIRANAENRRQRAWSSCPSEFSRS